MDKKRIRNKSLSDNRSKSQKEAAQKRSQTWKPGQSGNPAGAPKRGESWREIYNRLGDMTPKQAAEYCKGIAGQLASLGDGITLKEAVGLRVFAALIFEPSASLLNAVVERVEGRVEQPISIAWQDEYRRAIAAREVTPEALRAEFDAMIEQLFSESGAEIVVIQN